MHSKRKGDSPLKTLPSSRQNNLNLHKYNKEELKGSAKPYILGLFGNHRSCTTEFIAIDCQESLIIGHCMVEKSSKSVLLWNL